MSIKKSKYERRMKRQPVKSTTSGGPVTPSTPQMLTEPQDIPRKRRTIPSYLRDFIRSIVE